MGLCSQFILNEGTNTEETVTGFKIERYYSHNNDIYNGLGVGYNLDTRPIQYPDNWGTNDRLTIKTDASGANKISISNLYLVQTNYTGIALKLAVTDSPAITTSGLNGVLMNLDGTGSIDVKLLPNTVYYVWVYCNGRSNRYSDGDILVSASGTYGAAAQIAASDCLFGSTTPIYLSGSTDGATYTVTATYGGSTDTLLTDSTNTMVNFTPIATRVTNASEVQATISCTTKYSGNTAGTTTLQITIRYPDSYAPTKTEGSDMVTITASNTGGAASSTFASLLIQGYSKAHVKLNKSNILYQSGASLAAFSITYQNSTFSTDSVSGSNIYLETGVISNTSASIICTVTDTRGLTYSETVTISLSPYSKPSIGDVSVFRSTSGGVKDEDGSCITASASCAFSTISGNNTVTLTLSYKLLSSSTWSIGPTMSLANSLYSGTITGLSPDSAYDIKISVVDGIGNTSEFIKQLPTRKWAMKFRPTGDGVAFGKSAEADKELELPSDWTIKFGTTDWVTKLLDSTRLVFSNVNNNDYTITWSTNDTTYTGYPNKATITLTGVTGNHIPQVTFSLADAESGNYAPIADTDLGHVYIWAKELPSGTPPSISIPTIECRR